MVRISSDCRLSAEIQAILNSGKKRTKKQLLLDWKEHKHMVPTEIEKWVKGRGHVMLWTPPSAGARFQPIETLFGVSKNDVALYFVNGRTLGQTKEQFLHAILKFGMSPSVYSGALKRTHLKMEEWEEEERERLAIVGPGLVTHRITEDNVVSDNEDEDEDNNIEE